MNKGLAVIIERADGQPMTPDEKCAVSDVLAETLADECDGYAIVTDTDPDRQAVKGAQVQCCRWLCQLCRAGAPAHKSSTGKWRHGSGPWGLGPPLCPAGPIWDKLKG